MNSEASGCNEIYSDTTVMPYDQWVMTGFTFSKVRDVKLRRLIVCLLELYSDTCVLDVLAMLGATCCNRD